MTDCASSVCSMNFAIASATRTTDPNDNMSTLGNCDPRDGATTRITAHTRKYSMTPAAFSLAKKEIHKANVSGIKASQVSAEVDCK